VRVAVATQEYHLKKEHTGGPDRSASTKPGQNLFADEWLHLEKQKGA
jgi:hypothetical protein